MISVKSITAILLLCMVIAEAFTTVSTRATSFGVSTQQSSTTSLYGLFDFLQQPSKPSGGGGSSKGSKGPKKDLSVFGGRGAKITIREDEDNAMWVDEPKDKKKKGGK